jgi:hypothetical protein
VSAEGAPLKRSVRLLRSYCVHTFLLVRVQGRGTQQWYEKGIYGVVFIDKAKGQACLSFVGGVRRRLALSAIAPRLTPPTIRMLSSWLFKSMLRFHSSGA